MIYSNGQQGDSDAAETGATVRVSTANPVSGDVVEADEIQTGQIIRGFRIIERLEVGGFGEVFKAEQLNLKRLVAFKVLKSGMDSQEIVARFEAEQRAMARLDHPNIAKIIDGGLTPRGRMFFAMEFVPGETITDYCDRRRLKVSERLRIFLEVCEAIHHAHQRGIIHRDIKPNNVLVAERDNKPFPKVIDFGLAKALFGHLSEEGVCTIHNHFLGTPLYMSPEQAERGGMELDGRSDIYSLGVLLYQLLCAKTPIESQEVGRKGIEAIRKLILETDPRRPSTRIVQFSDEAAASVAHHRDCDVDSLVQTLSEDLDRVVIKCLEKDRNRRYATVAELMDELRSYLSKDRLPTAPQNARRSDRRRNGYHPAIYCVLAVLVTAVGWFAHQSLAMTAEREFALRFKVSYPPPAGQFARIGDDFRVRWIPAGRFMMGSPEFLEGSTNRDRLRGGDEIEHEVVFGRGFFLSETECTQAQWESVMESNPSNLRGADRPVEKVSWTNAVEFCRSLTAKHRKEGWLPEGWEWRLPTEAEWEYAARAGMVSPGHGDLETVAWHAGNSGGSTHPVGRKQANLWGLYDMLGNVWEWCLDWYGDYPNASSVKPNGPKSGSMRVFRGGCITFGLSDSARKFRYSHRSGIDPKHQSSDVGFRPALAEVGPSN
jgi:serine/threonine protein kinase